MYMSSRKMLSYLFALLFVLSNVILFAQTLTSGTVVGSVADSTGAAVTSAIVTITQADTGAVRTVKTNESGQYRFPFVKPGDYTISAKSAGLTADVSHFSLLVGQEQQINLVLAVQSVQQSVFVNSSASLLETENANQATSYGEKEVENMPINGGDITNIAFSTPVLRLNVGGGNTNFNVNGLPFSSALFTVNGAEINEPYNLNNKSGASNNTLGANDIQEAGVVLNAYSAQYGRMAGAQVNYITKSGSNAFHGNLIYNYNSDFLNSNDFFKNASNTPRPHSVANQYSGSLGGPIIRNKTFFFVNTEGLRYVLPASAIVSVPSPQFENYILAHVPASSVPLYQDAFKLYNNAPGVDRAVPVTTGNGPLQDSSGHLGCQSVGTFAGTSAGNGQVFGVNTPCALAFGTNVNQVNTEQIIEARVDHSLTDK